MEITIVEPCPECGTVPNKFTVTKDENGYTTWLHIECPNCGWKLNYKHVDADFVLRNWNDSASSRRIEKAAKPCPFCGSNELEIAMESNLLWAVTCQECEGRSGLHNTKEDALDAWNKRPDSDE